MASPDEPPRPYAVLDIDGVLADVRHRLHLVRSRPKRWDAFFDAAGDDPVLPEGLALAAELAVEHAVVYVSGRPERCRQATHEWLSRNGFPPGALHLRRNDDRRPARLVKVAVVRRLAARAPMALVVDDDDDVVAALRAAGFTVRHADWMADAADGGEPVQPSLFDPFAPGAGPPSP